jgi:hypothetical protein
MQDELTARSIASESEQSPEADEQRAERLPTHKRVSSAVALTFTLAIFLGAFLLFLIQPLIARYLLPWYGGGPSVWTTCLLFFQAVLLIGYAYAHLSIGAVTSGKFSARAQAALHGILLVAAIAALPLVVPSATWKPIAGDVGNPAFRILAMLTVTVGLPYFVLSSTAPLLQGWFARLDPSGDASRTYRLYAVSNIGSLLALLGYPLLLEPSFSRGEQALFWQMGIGVFALLCAVCTVAAARTRGAAPSVPASTAEPASDRAGAEDAPAAATPRRLLWLALPACASVLLLATTTTLTQDVAPVPLLWVVPLALYLLSFIVSFAGDRWYRRPIFIALLVVSLALASRALHGAGHGGFPIVARTVILLAALFICCTVCHGELARLRPPTRYLTGYYLTISAGGALGGLLVAIVAPLILDRYIELYVGLWFCGLLALLARRADASRPPLLRMQVQLSIAGLIVLAIFLWAGATKPAQDNTDVVFRTRDFYGALRVEDVHPKGADDKDVRLLVHGAIGHGGQILKNRRMPNTYYAPESGIGLVLRDPPAAGGRRVGVIGLGSGTLAAYGRPGDVYRLYELSPSVASIANNFFTYLKDSRARCSIILGDGRLSLEREPSQRFDVLVLDAFNGDAVPVHLLTAEAFEVYRRHLAPGGILAIHVSNKYMDLEAVLHRQAEHMQWDAVQYVLDMGTEVEIQGAYSSQWVLMSPEAASLARLREAGARPVPERVKVGVWTDEQVNLLQILR